MYTSAPIPSWAELLSGLLAYITKAKPIGPPWTQNEQQMALFASGTAILAYIVKKQAEKTKNKNLEIWLPDYFCNNATQLIRKQDVSITFYPINSMLDPEWSTCEQMVQTSSAPDIFILVHYFGREADVVRAAAFCRNMQTFLLEDAAHVLVPHGNIGKYGDAIFYCPHKVLAAPDGAILIRQNMESNLRLKKTPFPVTWLLKRVLQLILPKFFLKYRTQNLPGFLIDGRIAKKSPETLISALGYSMISVSVNRLNIIGNARKQAANKWREVFLPYNELCSAALSIEEEGPAPYRFVLKFKDSITATQVFTALRLEGIAVESWPDLAPYINENKSAYNVAYELRRTLLFFPIFQPLPSDLITLVNFCMKNALTDSSSVC